MERELDWFYSQGKRTEKKEMMYATQKDRDVRSHDG
jgi:hypothetical protein